MRTPAATPNRTSAGRFFPSPLASGHHAAHQTEQMHHTAQCIIAAQHCLHSHMLHSYRLTHLPSLLGGRYEQSCSSPTRLSVHFACSPEALFTAVASLASSKALIWQSACHLVNATGGTGTRARPSMGWGHSPHHSYYLADHSRYVSIDPRVGQSPTSSTIDSEQG